MSWREKEDLGTATVANLHDLLRIPDEWLVDRHRGFTWWAGDYAQSLWADLGLFHNGVTLYRLHCETEMLRGGGHARDCELQLTKLMGTTTLSGMTYESNTDLYKLHCSVYAQNENAEWVKRVLLGAMALQVIEAQNNSNLSLVTGHTAATTGHPSRGLRHEPDPILDSIKKFFKPYGAQDSKWIDSPEWDEARERVRRLAQHSVTDNQTYLEAEFDWHLSAAVLPIRLDIRTDRPHDILGNGLELSLTLPLAMPAGQRAHTALELNARERQEWNWCHDLGSWCTRGSEVMFHCFVPNICYSPGILIDMAHDMAIRANWVNENLSKDPISV